MPLTWEVYHESDKLFNVSLDEGEESKEGRHKRRAILYSVGVSSCLKKLSSVSSER